VIFTPDSLPAPLVPAALFGRTAPVEVDLGCGKGRFLLAHAAAHPGIDFMGTDIQVGRLQKIRRRAESAGLTNIRLLHADTAYTLEYLLPRESVSRFYLYFPDPWPKRKHHRRRIVQPAFMALVHRTLQRDGEFHIATDHEDYFRHIHKIVSVDPRFTRIEPFEPSDDEKTDFEVLFTANGMKTYRYSCAKTDAGG
jgi:tRNA (guanine-N7-)-methyltransferase